MVRPLMGNLLGPERHESNPGVAKGSEDQDDGI